MNAESCKKGTVVVQVRAEVGSDDGEKWKEPGETLEVEPTGAGDGLVVKGLRVEVVS